MKTWTCFVSEENVEGSSSLSTFRNDLFHNQSNECSLPSKVVSTIHRYNLGHTYEIYHYFVDSNKNPNEIRNLNVSSFPANKIYSVTQSIDALSTLTKGIFNVWRISFEWQSHESSYSVDTLSMKWTQYEFFQFCWKFPFEFWRPINENNFSLITFVRLSVVFAAMFFKSCLRWSSVFSFTDSWVSMISHQEFDSMRTLSNKRIRQLLPALSWRWTLSFRLAQSVHIFNCDERRAHFFNGKCLRFHRSWGSRH